MASVGYDSWSSVESSSTTVAAEVVDVHVNASGRGYFGFPETATHWEYARGTLAQ